MSGFCFQKWRWVIPPKYLFLKNVGNRLEFIIMDFVSVNDAPWPSQMALDFVSKNDARWDTRTFDCFQLWPSISSRDDVTHVTSHHARTPLPTPYLPHMTSLSYRHVWRHKWRKFIFGFCFHEWRWVKTPKCCQYGLKLLIVADDATFAARVVIFGHFVQRQGGIRVVGKGSWKKREVGKI